MWLVAGLGNPGTRYEKTRHNVGFLALQELLERLHLEFKEKEDHKISRGSVGDEKIILLEPLTFMNRSGTAVRKIMRKSDIAPERLIVIHDDLDLESGRLKIRKKGSSGGHRGIELSKFRKDEMPVIREAISKAVESVFSVISDGADRTMNRFNKI